MNLSLVDAFSRFGAKPANRLRGLSAMASDGAMVLNCLQAYFGHPSQGVLRYEDKLSREPEENSGNELLKQHLTLAKDGELPVRMVVMTTVVNATTSKSTRSFHVRPDLVGKVVLFDGDHFIIDFTRQVEVEIKGAHSGERRR
jgi:hypothetical protein